jgi:hypothetical protein
MQVTIEFFRIREADDAHATLDRVPYSASGLEAAKTHAISLFETLDMPQAPDGLRILDDAGREVFAWRPAS